MEQLHEKLKEVAELLTESNNTVKPLQLMTSGLKW